MSSDIQCEGSLSLCFNSARFGNEISTFATPDARLHAMRRGAVNQFFSRQRIIALEPIIREKLALLITNIRKYEVKEELFNLKGAWNAFVGDVIMRYCFAFDYDHLNSDGFSTNWHEPFWAVTRTGPLAMQYPAIPKILNALPFALVEQLDPLFAHLVRLRRDLIKKIKAVKATVVEKDSTTSTQSVLAAIVQNAELPTTEKSDQRLMDEAQLLLAAGLLTTAWALSVGSFHVIKNPTIFKTLRAELEAAIPDPAGPDVFKWTELEKLPYLTGCIKEAIRLSNPATHRSQRRYNEPIRYKDWIIPARTAIGMNQTDVLNDEKIFPDHMEFRPERWTNQEKTAYGLTVDKFNVLFGKGSRSCLGVNLAWCELYLAMAGVFRNFKFELYKTDESDVQVKHDFWLPSPKLDSKGVRVRCVH